MMRQLTIYIMICIAALCFHSCSPEDDINGIFVGKTWKLSNICNDKDAPLLSQDDVDQVDECERYESHRGSDELSFRFSCKCNKKIPTSPEGEAGFFWRRGGNYFFAAFWSLA